MHFMFNSRTFGYGKYFVFYCPALTPTMIDECTKRSTTLWNILSKLVVSEVNHCLGWASLIGEPDVLDLRTFALL